MKHFAIVTEARCGYQLLAQLLNSNPEVRCLGEIYSSNPATRRKSMFSHEFPIIEEWADGVEYFEKIKQSIDRPIFGFKLGYVCARREEWQNIRAKVLSDRWPVIHLYRENYLDRVISDKLASYEENWNNREYHSKIPLHPEELQYLYNRGLKWRTDAKAYLVDNPVLWLSYEELTQDRDAACEKVQRLIGANPIKLSCAIKKQRVGSQRQYIKNYKQLYDSCINHPIFGKWLDGISYL